MLSAEEISAAKMDTEHSDQLGSLVKAVQRGSIQPDPFVDQFFTAMTKVRERLFEYNPASTGPLDDAYSELTEAVLKYRDDPDLEGVREIGNKLVTYRREAASLHPRSSPG
jgi:hypothetical protein